MLIELVTHSCDNASSFSLNEWANHFRHLTFGGSVFYMNAFTIIGFLLTLVLTPLAHADEKKCTIELRTQRVEPKCQSEDPIQTFVTYVNSWQDCYEVATNLSGQYDFETYGRGLLDCFTETFIGKWTEKTYVHWNFDDSYFNDSKGDVSVYTKQYFTRPVTGNKAVDQQGFSFR